MRRKFTTRNAFVRDARGGVLIYFAVFLPVMLGLMGLVVDLAVWNLNKRVVQNAADIAAIAAALENKRSGRQRGKVAAKEIALVNGLRLRTPGAFVPRNGNRFAAKGSGQAKPDVMIVNIPPSQGPLRRSRDAVEVLVARRVPVFLSAIFIKGPITVRGRAVAVARPVDGCLPAQPIESEQRGRPDIGSDNRWRDCGNAAASEDERPAPYPFQALAPAGRSAGMVAYDSAPPSARAGDNGLDVSPYGGPAYFDPRDDTSPMPRKGPFKAYIVE